ncbi:MAG TPA: hypothetical protein PLL69_00075 [Gemmatimonadales bacterium]|nr:hypothetical protein [Gemmatimonadales bacterium]
MTVQSADPIRAAWEAIARERRVDRLIRTLCLAAWAVTLVIAGGYAWLVWTQVAHARQLFAVGAATREEAMAAAIPLVLALGVLALLVAALSTIGVFLRFRGATMQEIQLRLAALERMVGNEK